MGAYEIKSDRMWIAWIKLEVGYGKRIGIVKKLAWRKNIIYLIARQWNNDSISINKIKRYRIRRIKSINGLVTLITIVIKLKSKKQ